MRILRKLFSRHPRSIVNGQMTAVSAGERIDFLANSRWTAGVVGLGYVGLPLLLACMRNGLAGIGFDVSEVLVDSLNSGKSHVDDVSEEDIQKALADDVHFTIEPARLSECDAVFLCVPSPLGRNRQPDLSFIEAASRTVSQVARRGQLLVLESTSYPGTTEEFLLPALRAAGFEVDRDVFVAFSPERLSPGDQWNTTEIPRVVGGVTELSGLVAAAAYRRIVSSVHLVSSARTAEMAKLLENTYRAVNIGLINEMAQLAHELDIDIWEVVEAAATKPFGFQPFYPGPGVGGHCIPLDPQYLSWRAREANFATRFVDIAEQINSKMPLYNVTRISDLLNSQGLPVFGTPILAVGIAYKRNVTDERESAPLDVVTELSRRGGRVSILDPLVGSERIRQHGFEPVSAESDLSEFAIAVILTDHDGIDYQKIAQQVPLVYDTRAVFRRLAIESDKIIPL